MEISTIADIFKLAASERNLTVVGLEIGAELIVVVINGALIAFEGTAIAILIGKAGAATVFFDGSLAYLRNFGCYHSLPPRSVTQLA